MNLERNNETNKISYVLLKIKKQLIVDKDYFQGNNFND